MISELQVLMLSAISIACLHTITGPDHYLPFIALSKLRQWSLARTLSWTVICGCGHVWSSVLLGLGAAALGWSLSSVSWLESVRGGIAGWALIIFGLVYATWGVSKANANNQHKHFDIYTDGAIYVYEHRHGEAIKPADRHPVTPWVMFVIFVLGPCEPMIPLLYYPAVKHSWRGIMLIVIIYTIFTLVTMITIVAFGYYGISMVKVEKFKRFSHFLGGITILLCGAGMVFMGW